MAEGKVILILVDALGFQTAVDRSGYLGHLVESGGGALYRVRGELPAQSRPMYETVMTGLPASRHGVCSNSYCGASRCDNLFSLCRRAGKGTAAAAYMWMSELYNATPRYDPLTDRIQIGNPYGGLIDNGMFYSADDYPDSHLYQDGDYLRRAFRPDFLLIHPMNVDDQGHRHGADSREYQHAAEKNASTIAGYLDTWRADGYSVIVTADHGMDALGLHIGDTPLQREIPLFVFSDRVKPGRFTDHAISQLNVAPLCCALLGIAPAEGMVEVSKEIEFQ